MEDLGKKKCMPCNGTVPPLGSAPIAGLKSQLDPSWRVVDNHHLERDVSFGAYQEAVAFTNTIAQIAEDENHHPDILLTFGKVRVTIWTHKIDGLTLSDFVFAAKVDAAFKALE